MGNISQDGLDKYILDNSEIKTNLGQTIIITTEDKIRLCLMNYLNALQEKRGWLTPLSLALAIVLTFLTTDFKKWILPKEGWQAFFLIALIIFLSWFIIALIKSFKTKTLDDVVGEIKKTQIKNADKN